MPRPSCQTLALLALLPLAGHGIGAVRAAAPPVNPLTDTRVYPVAVWAMPSRTAAAFAALGVNIFVAGEENPRGWCDTLAASGCVGLVHWSGRRSAAARQEIVASPGFLGWMHGDEPDNPAVVDDVFRSYRHPPDRLLASYRQMQASSTPAPMYLNLGQGLANGMNQTTPDSVYTDFCRTADIVCYDVYPTSTQHRGTERLHLVARGVERLRRFAGPDKPLWVWLECTRLHGDASAVGERCPLPHELRAQVWMAIVHGADGIGFFPHQFNPYRGGPAAIPAPIQAEMQRTNGLLHALAPVLRTGAKERLTTTPGTPRLSAALWRQDAQAVLVAVNLSPEMLAARIQLPAGMPPLSALGDVTVEAGAAAPAAGETGSAAVDAAAAPATLALRLRPYEVAVFTGGLEAQVLAACAAPGADGCPYSAPEPEPPPVWILDRYRC